MKYLASTYYFDYDHENIQTILQEYKTETLSDKEKAVAIYHFVRDRWRYNPYHIGFQDKHYKASNIVHKQEGHCIDKCILLITFLRGLGIPARIQLAKVKNHIAAERLEERFGTNELSPHGMVNILLEGKWLKASPAFNASLCEMCHVAPLEFNGEEDSIFQQYNEAGDAFMEYLEDYGHFPDLPIDFIRENMRNLYPALAPVIDERGELRL